MLSTALIEEALSIRLGPRREIRCFCSDSRAVEAGDFFVAIKGEKFDGHDFLEDVARRGALGAFVSNSSAFPEVKLPESFLSVKVPDPIEALRSVASTYRSSLKIPIFAVAGSNGKTTTKEWIAFLLSQLEGAEVVFKSQKSENSILGIALSLLRIRNEKMAVLEVGIDEPGWMERHLSLVRPSHGLITTIAEEHLARLGSIEKIAEQELLLMKYLDQHKGSFAANLDSPWIRNAKIGPHVLTYALDESADLEGLYLKPNQLHAFGLTFVSPLPGKHNALNLLAALAAVKLLKPETSELELRSLSKKTKDFQGEAHRSQWIELPNEIRIFDDCYNANSDSMEKALQTFQDLTEGCVQKIILGDMFDLGESSEAAHRRILNLALVLGFDRIFLFGETFSRVSKEPSFKDPRLMAFTDIKDLETQLLQDVQRHDTVLIKGSRGNRLERLIPVLTGLKPSS